MNLSHKTVWDLIEQLAARHNLSPSGLARLAGLDPTSFNKSKRQGADGRLRWPSTESLSKIMEATDTPFTEFANLLNSSDVDSTEGFPSGNFPPQASGIPILGFAQAGAGGFFDDAGFPIGEGWDKVDFPIGIDTRVSSSSAYALKVQGESMLPLYRDGDVLIVDPDAQLHTGDRVVAKTYDGEVMAKVLSRHAVDQIELLSLNPEHPNRTFQRKEIEWIARIIWASQ